MTQPALTPEVAASILRGYKLGHGQGKVTDAELYEAHKIYGSVAENYGNRVPESTNFQGWKQSQNSGEQFTGRARDWPGLHPRTVRWGHVDALKEGRWAWRMWQAARLAQTPLYAATLTPHRTISELLALAPSPVDRMASAERLLHTIETTTFSAWRLEHCATASYHWEGIVSGPDLEAWQTLATRFQGSLNLRPIADEAMFRRQLKYMTKGARHRRNGRDVALWELAGHSVQEFTDEIMMLRARQSRRPSMIVRQNIPSREDLAALVDAEPFGAALARFTLARKHRVDRECRAARHQVQLAEMAAEVNEWQEWERDERRRERLAFLARPRLTTAPRKGRRPVTAPPRHRNTRRPAGRHSTAYRMANAPPGDRKTDAEAPVSFSSIVVVGSPARTPILYTSTQSLYTSTGALFPRHIIGPEPAHKWSVNATPEFRPDHHPSHPARDA